MAKIKELAESLEQYFSSKIEKCLIANQEITLEVAADNLLEVGQALKSETKFGFDTLIDICGVDYSAYGKTEWKTEVASFTGFSRAVQADSNTTDNSDARRFAVVYHFLSVSNNHRLRLRVFAPESDFPKVPSVIDLWNAANWYEREAFDLYGIVFDGHPDLRRLLTDYGFIGHPFRKDFPLIGQVEMRYDPDKKRVVYEPVSIEPRILVPKVIRHDHRFDHPKPNALEDSESDA